MAPNDAVNTSGRRFLPAAAAGVAPSGLPRARRAVGGSKIGALGAGKVGGTWGGDPSRTRSLRGQSKPPTPISWRPSCRRPAPSRGRESS